MNKETVKKLVAYAPIAAAIAFAVMAIMQLVDLFDMYDAYKQIKLWTNQSFFGYVGTIELLVIIVNLASCGFLAFAFFTRMSKYYIFGAIGLCVAPLYAVIAGLMTMFKYFHIATLLLFVSLVVACLAYVIYLVITAALTTNYIPAAKKAAKKLWLAPAAMAVVAVAFAAVIGMLVIIFNSGNFGLAIKTLFTAFFEGIFNVDFLVTLFALLVSAFFMAFDGDEAPELFSGIPGQAPASTNENNF